MNRFSITLIILLLISSIVLAQEKSLNNNTEVENLISRINNTEEYGVRTQIYKNIIEKSYPDNLDQVFQYSKELLLSAEQSNDKVSIGYANFYLGKYYYDNDDFENAFSYFSIALDIYNGLNDNNMLAEIHYNLGLANQYLNHWDEALENYQKSVEIFSSLGNHEKSS